MEVLVAVGTAFGAALTLALGFFKEINKRDANKTANRQLDLDEKTFFWTVLTGIVTGTISVIRYFTNRPD